MFFLEGKLIILNLLTVSGGEVSRSVVHSIAEQYFLDLDNVTMARFSLIKLKTIQQDSIQANRNETL